VLPASNSRAAWLAAVVSTGYLLYKYYSNGSVKLFPANNNLFNLYNKYTAHTYIKVASIALITIVMCTAALGLYNMKKDSADGRMLIWNVTGDIIKEKPVFGHGAGAFQAKYMEYQGKYFSANPNSNKAILAANNKYAFNEPLRIIAESGSVGFILILLALASLFRNKNNIASNKKQKPINSTGYLLLARATILSVLVFGMFSYPSKILPIKINLVLATAIVAGFQNPIKNSRRWKPVLRKITTTTLSATPVIPSPFFFRIALSVLSIIFLITASNVLLIKYSAFKIWKTAYTTYITGNYNKSINIYATAYPELKTNGSFLINYGKALSMAEEHKKAIEILKESKKYLQNTITYTTLGDSYKTLGYFQKAERAYQIASDMIPSRFYAKYLLAKLYDETGQKNKALRIAKELLQMKVKVGSLAIHEIHEAMEQLILRHQMPESTYRNKGLYEPGLLCYSEKQIVIST
jgi:tetratricopeptide (TPR) repeat protein